MSDKLTIALYKGEIIHLSNYNRDTHHGELYCPFCDPPIRVTFNIKGYFMAWKNEGLHNCSKRQPVYFDADWKGRKITEIIQKGAEGIDVIIDIYSLTNRTYEKIDDYNLNSIDNNSTNDKRYPNYTERKEVFRDVIRSVIQMKKLIDKNNYDNLKKIKFHYRTGDNSILNINDILINSYELNTKFEKKSLFVILKVKDAVLSNKKVYINAESYGNVNLTVTFSFNGISNPYKSLKGKGIIAFGKVNYSSTINKFFLNLNNDFQMEKINDNMKEEIFGNVELNTYDYIKYCKRENKTNKQESIYEVSNKCENNSVTITKQSYVDEKGETSNEDKVENQIYDYVKPTNNDNIVLHNTRSENNKHKFKDILKNIFKNKLIH